MPCTPAIRRRLEFSAFAGALTLAIVGVALLPSADAGFTAKAANEANSLSSVSYFTCTAAITSDAPAVWYRLDETSGTTAQNAAQGNDGTYRGTTTKGQGRACPRDSGSAVTFNGSSGYVSLGTNFTVPTTYSLEAWVKTSTTSGGFIGGIGASTTGASATVDRVLYLTSRGRLAFGINHANKATITSTDSYNDGVWHHVAVTLGPDGMKLYVDGARVATSSTTATGTYNGYLRVGYDDLTGWTNAPTSNYLKATLDDVAAYTTTLSASDVASHYEAGT